jgi:16S rRNA G1207 methylase RsmC
MADMPKSLIRSVVGQLQKERTRLQDELRRVTAALSAFGRVYMQGSKTRGGATRKRRTMSAVARKRIAAAQRARWAKVRAKQAKGVRRSKRAAKGQ